MRKWRITTDKSPSHSRMGPPHSSHRVQDASSSTGSDSFNQRTDVRGERSAGADQSAPIKLNKVGARREYSVGPADVARRRTTSSGRRRERAAPAPTSCVVSGCMYCAVGIDDVRRASEVKRRTEQTVRDRRRSPDPLDALGAAAAPAAGATSSAETGDWSDRAIGRRSCSDSPSQWLDNSGDSEFEFRHLGHGNRPSADLGFTSSECEVQRNVFFFHEGTVPEDEDHRPRVTGRVVEFGNPVYCGLIDWSSSISDASHSSRAGQSTSVDDGIDIRYNSSPDEVASPAQLLDHWRSRQSSAKPIGQGDRCSSSARSEPSGTSRVKSANVTVSGGHTASAGRSPSSPGHRGVNSERHPYSRSPSTTSCFEEDGVGLVDPFTALTELRSDQRRVLGQCPCHTPDSGIGLVLDAIPEEEEEAEDWSPKADYNLEDSDDEWIVISAVGTTDTVGVSGQYLLVHGYNLTSVC